MVVLQYAFLTHIILMDPYDNPKHKKTLIGAVLEHLKFTESRLNITPYAYPVMAACRAAAPARMHLPHHAWEHS